MMVHVVSENEVVKHQLLPMRSDDTACYLWLIHMAYLRSRHWSPTGLVTIRTSQTVSIRPSLPPISQLSFTQIIKISRCLKCWNIKMPISITRDSANETFKITPSWSVTNRLGVMLKWSGPTYETREFAISTSISSCLLNTKSPGIESWPSQAIINGVMRSTGTRGHLVISTNTNKLSALLHRKRTQQILQPK